MRYLKLPAPKLKQILSLLRKSSKSLSLLLLFQIVPATYSWGVLNRTYPTAATTILRMDTYEDSLNTVWGSTYTMKLSTWVFQPDQTIYVSTGTNIYGFTATLNPSTTTIVYVSSGTIISSTTVTISSWTVVGSTWDIGTYSNMLINEAKYEFLNEVLDQDMEEYLVWPSTVSCPIGWQGWMLAIAPSGNTYYVPCVYAN